MATDNTDYPPDVVTGPRGTKSIPPWMGKKGVAALAKAHIAKKRKRGAKLGR